MRVKGAGVWHEARDLPALLLVLVDEGAVKAKLARKAQARLLGGSVDHLLGP